jgi:tripartite-type tricarboxylate transporter receptor subunit TctC
VVHTLESTLKKVSEDPDFRKAMENMGQPVMFMGSEEYTKFIKQATADYAKIIKDLNIKID